MEIFGNFFIFNQVIFIRQQLKQEKGGSLGKTASCIMLTLLLTGVLAFSTSSLGDASTVDVPIFDLLSKESKSVEGGINMKFTFKNIGQPATAGTVFIPWNKVWCRVQLSGSPPTGNLSEALLRFDVNGDGDMSDAFMIFGDYADDRGVEIDGVWANAMFVSKGEDMHYVFEKNYFMLGSKNHTLYKVSYNQEYEYGFADFGLDSFFLQHFSPNIEFVIEQSGASISSTPTAQIVSMSLNGTLIPYDFNWIDVGQHSHLKWLMMLRGYGL